MSLKNVSDEKMKDGNTVTIARSRVSTIHDQWSGQVTMVHSELWSREWPVIETSTPRQAASPGTSAQWETKGVKLDFRKIFQTEETLSST